ncbi:hypothetical protein HDU96_002392 [Phlyctochytrium bullatum]|nr:hypothetical protein HDU96_002392 [Phlyctochytrium bullatum]
MSTVSSSSSGSSPSDDLSLPQLLRTSAITSGPLNKLSSSDATGLPFWKRRHMVLCPDRLVAFRTDRPTPSNRPVGVFPLDASSQAYELASETPASLAIFEIRTSSSPNDTDPRTWTLQCASRDEMAVWLGHLRHAIAFNAATAVGVLTPPLSPVGPTPPAFRSGSLALAPPAHRTPAGPGHHLSTYGAPPRPIGTPDAAPLLHKRSASTPGIASQHPAAPRRAAPAPVSALTSSPTPQLPNPTLKVVDDALAVLDRLEQRNNLLQQLQPPAPAPTGVGSIPTPSRTGPGAHLPPLTLAHLQMRRQSSLPPNGGIDHLIHSAALLGASQMATAAVLGHAPPPPSPAGFPSISASTSMSATAAWSPRGTTGAPPSPSPTSPTTLVASSGSSVASGKRPASTGGRGGGGEGATPSPTPTRKELTPYTEVTFEIKRKPETGGSSDLMERLGRVGLI